MEYNIINKEVKRISDNQIMIIIMVLSFATQVLELIIKIIQKERD